MIYVKSFPSVTKRVAGKCNQFLTNYKDASVGRHCYGAMAVMCAVVVSGGVQRGDGGHDLSVRSKEAWSMMLFGGMVLVA